MRFLVVSLFVSLGLLLAAPAKKSAGKPAPKPAPKAASSQAASKTAAKKTTSRRTRRTARRGSGYMQGQRRPGQRVPTPERYKEIEAALASRGYLAKEPDGAWGQKSVDALKKFQQDQNLEPTGKLTSLSLIALGLGPKHDTATSSPQQ